MKKYIYIPFALCVVAATALGIVFKNYYRMTSWIWLPAIVLLTLAVTLEVFIDIGSLLRKKREKNIKDYPCRLRLNSTYHFIDPDF